MLAASDKQMLTSGLFNNCSVLADCVDKMHCVRAETTEASEGRNVELQQNLDVDFYREPIDLTGRKTSADGHAKVSTIVERAVFFMSHIVRG